MPHLQAPQVSTVVVKTDVFYIFLLEPAPKNAKIDEKTEVKAEGKSARSRDFGV